MSAVVVACAASAAWMLLGAVLFARTEPRAFRETAEGITTIALWPLLVGLRVRNTRRLARTNAALAEIRGHNEVHLIVLFAAKDMPDDAPVTTALLDQIRDDIDVSEAGLGHQQDREWLQPYVDGFLGAAKVSDRFRDDCQASLDRGRPLTVADLRRSVPHRDVPDRWTSPAERKRRRKVRRKALESNPGSPSATSP